jgi:hypothetical protein
MRRAKGACRAVLIAEERQQKARWFYLSFATGYAFLGAAIVRGHGFLTAIQAASDLNINPGGEVMDRPLNWRHMKSIPADSSFLARRHRPGGPVLLLADPLTHNRRHSRSLEM